MLPPSGGGRTPGEGIRVCPCRWPTHPVVAYCAPVGWTCLGESVAWRRAIGYGFCFFVTLRHNRLFFYSKKPPANNRLGSHPTDRSPYCGLMHPQPPRRHSSVAKPAPLSSQGGPKGCIDRRAVPRAHCTIVQRNRQGVNLFSSILLFAPALVLVPVH